MVDILVSFIINFFVVLSSIGLFFAPFVFVFWFRRRTEIAGKNPHFNYFMEKFFLSKESNLLVMTWAAAEAIAWFVIPEFLLVLVVFMKVRRKMELVIYDIIGTTIGTIFAVWLHFSDTTLLSLPYIYQGMITNVEGWYDQYGVLGIFFQPFSGVPYKVFNGLAFDHAFFIPLFIILAIIARMIRYLIVYEVTKAIYPFSHRFVRKHYLILFVIATLIFTILLMKVSLSYR